jgi:hypothetical protein
MFDAPNLAVDGSSTGLAIAKNYIIKGVRMRGLVEDARFQNGMFEFGHLATVDCAKAIPNLSSSPVNAGGTPQGVGLAHTPN